MTHQDVRAVQTRADVALLQTDLATAEADVVTFETQRVRKVSLLVGFADLVASAGSQELPFAAPLPAGAVIVGSGINATVGFTDGAGGVFTADVGINTGDVDAMLDGVDIASIAKFNVPQGVAPTGLVGAITPSITVRADVDVDTATAGSLLAEIYYVDSAVLD